MNGALKLCVLLVGTMGVTACATSPKAPEHPVRAHSAGRSLLSLVPHQAAMALVLRSGTLDTLRKAIADAPSVKAAIVKQSLAHFGVDLTAARGAAAFGVFTRGDGALAVVVVLPGPARPRGQPAARYHGTALHRLGQWVVAGVPRGLVLGNALGVRTYLDRMQGRTAGLSAASRLAPLLRLDGAQISLAAAVDRAALVALEVGTENEHGILQEIELLTLQVGADGRLAADLKCRPGKAQRVKDRLSAPLTKGVFKLRRVLTRQEQAIPAALALSLFHPFRRWLRELEPEIRDHHLVIDTRLPDLQMKSLSALFWSFEVGRYMGSLQQRLLRHRAGAPLVMLDSLSRRARDLLKRHRGDPGTFRFPGSTPWTGDRPCCDGPVPRSCAVARETLDHPTWKALGFTPRGPLYHHYRFVSTGAGASASFKLEARADLDCDGEQGTVTMRGEAGKNFKAGGTSYGPMIAGELE